MNKIIIAVDCGLNGAISILEGDNIEVHLNCTKIEKRNKKDKKVYDFDKILELLKKYSNKEVLFIVERQGVRFSEGSVSSFTTGQGFGWFQGVGMGLGFSVIIVPPQLWKKHYDKLETKEIAELRSEQKIVKVKLKVIKIENKSIKDKALKKSNKIKEKELNKEVEKIGRKIKSLSKDKAREIASKIAPKIADSFKKKNSDGLAEAVLIAMFFKDNHYELVQESEKGEEDDND